MPYPSSVCVNVKSFGATGNGGTDDTTAFENALAASSEVFIPYGNYILSRTLTIKPGQKIFGNAGSWSDLRSSANPCVAVTGAGTGNGVSLCNIRIHITNTNATGLLWDGDKSSVALSCIVTAANGTSQPQYYHRSGGAFFEEIEPAIDSSGNATVCHKITSNDPLYLIGDAADHVVTASWTMDSASKVYIFNVGTEYPNGMQTQGNTINNCHQIYLDGIMTAAPYCGGCFSSQYIWTITNSPNVTAWGLSDVDASGQNAGGPRIAELSNGGVNYGTMGQTLGFMDSY